MIPSGKTPEEFVTISVSNGSDENTPCWKHLLTLLDDVDPLDYLNVFEIEITSAIERERAAEDRWEELYERVQINIDAVAAELDFTKEGEPKDILLIRELFRLNVFKKWMKEVEGSNGDV